MIFYYYLCKNVSKMKEPKRILFVNSEIYPYLPESKIALPGRFLPQGIQESGKEVRIFMPRYGCVNERRNQLHEVIRLSGMNMVINDIDHPLVIKVASISSARMQVYFIDNEDYFHRKAVFEDSDGKFMEDNDERAIFFARGVLETVKKLRWKPDIVHCSGWISYLVPIYLKKAYKNDPVFSDAKVVLSLFGDYQENTFDPGMKEKIILPGIKAKDLAAMEETDGINLAKLALQYTDAVILSGENIHSDILEAVRASGVPTLENVEIDHPDGTYIKKYNEFYDQLLPEDAN